MHTSGRAARERRYPPFPLGSGHISPRDVAAPPALLDEIAQAAAADIESARLELRRTFVAEGIHGLPSDGGGCSFGWGAHAARPDGEAALWIWFDGIDHDLAVMVADRHWFEWQDLDDPTTVAEEATAVVTAALAGRITPGPSNTATAHLPDGRSITTEPPPPG